MCCCFFCRIAACFVIFRIALGAVRLFLVLVVVTVAAAPLVAAARLVRDVFDALDPGDLALSAVGVLGAGLAVCAVARRRHAD